MDKTASKPMPRRTYWLIEWLQQPAPYTHLHPEAEWLSRGVHNWTIESARIEKWTKDVREAIRFPSKEDAEAVIGWLWGRETSIHAATEHEDVDSPPLSPSEPQASVRGAVIDAAKVSRMITGRLYTHDVHVSRGIEVEIEAIIAQAFAGFAPKGGEAVAYLKKAISHAASMASDLRDELDFDDNDDPQYRAAKDIETHLLGALIGFKQDFEDKAHPPTAQPPAQVDARGEVYKATHFLIQQLAELVRLTQPESAKVKWRGTLIDRESVVQIVIRMRDSIDGLNDYFRKHTLAVEPTAQEDES